MPKCHWVVVAIVAACALRVEPASASPPNVQNIKVCKAKAQYQMWSDVTGGDPAEIRKMIASQPRSEDLTGPGVDLLVAQCLMNMKDYADAAATYERAYNTKDIDKRALKHIWHDAPLGAAQAYWAMGKQAEAKTWITIAYVKNEESDDILPYYEQYTGTVPTPIAPEVKNGRAYWDAQSEDQRHVLFEHGGYRDDNQDARPCHVERYDATNYHQVTWWYCKDLEPQSYSKAYTFLNGRLTSTYTP
jgi:tetratricopeptide (TPR) repeat protein